MRRLIYSVLFPVCFLLAMPFYLRRMIKRGGYLRNFEQRFGLFSRALEQTLKGRKVLWLHAVSVGELNAAEPLIQNLLKRHPEHLVVLSTITSTGQELARKKAGDRIVPLYFPLDFNWAVKRALKLVNPDIVILMETEVWYNFLLSARASNIPVVLVNARLSDRSFPRYRKFKWFLQPAFESFRFIGAQTAEDKRRFVEVGAKKEAVIVTGNMKWDVHIEPCPFEWSPRRILDHLNVRGKVLLTASTHPGEEELLVQVFWEVKKVHPDLFWILVPRHFERADEISQLLGKAGLNVQLRTAIESSRAGSAADVLMVNTTGELKYYYEIADVVFVGRSLVGFGGQTIIEPSAAGKPILYGPHMENFREASTLLLNQNAAIQVSNPEELKEKIIWLLKNPGEAQTMGMRAKKVIDSNRGAVTRTAELIESRMKHRSK